jgi:hypothetical protein
MQKALLAEAAYYLDHAAKHSVTVRNQIAASHWYSSAWLCVTFYYWAFFLGLSLSRLIGNTAIFLSKTDVSQLIVLSGGRRGLRRRKSVS